MTRVKIKEAIVVEGRYDKNTLSQVVDASIFETSGFSVYHNRQLLSLLRRLAETRGLIIMTDPDAAGFQIRNFLRGAIDPTLVRHAYVPDVAGKERRKATGSKEGKLGVEGMRPEVLLDALRRAGATMDGDCQPAAKPITKLDLYAAGLSGGAGSAEKRRALCRHLDLPERISANALADVLGALMDAQELSEFAKTL